MKISTFNVENLFSRPAVMNLNTWGEGKDVLQDTQRLNDLLSKTIYSDSDKKNIEKILDKYEFGNRNKKGRPFDVIQVRGKLFSTPKGTQSVRVDAKGKEDWSGWISLTRDDIQREAIENTARVISEVRADIQLLVEVEDRPTLDRFNKQLLSVMSSGPFSFNMLVDGNDPRGIDLGLLSRYPIISVRSHTDIGGDKPIFSRDCPEYEISLPDGSTLWILGNHLKSKGYGNPSDSNAKRKKQAAEAAKLYMDARKRSDYVIVAGDFNDTPDSEALSPLIQGTDLKDVMTHSEYKMPFPGTYKTCKSANQKIDFILLSPTLWDKVKSVGIDRRGVYAPRAGEPFDTVISEETAASDHAALWVEIDI
jgi:endonuclease/exonuclease/phosphatase family metal-dependent hydrolase